MKFIKKFAQVFESSNYDRDKVVNFIDRFRYDGTEGPKQFTVNFAKIAKHIDKYVHSGIEEGKLFSGDELLAVFLKLAPDAKQYVSAYFK